MAEFDSSEYASASHDQQTKANQKKKWRILREKERNIRRGRERRKREKEGKEKVGRRRNGWWWCKIFLKIL